jgi:diphthine-ammonia ligase
MKAAVLYSGGKDSNLALELAVESGLNVSPLVSVKPKADDSYMFHKPCIDLTSLQAEALGIELIKKDVSGLKEQEVIELKNILSGLDVDAVVSGAVESSYQKTRIDSIASELSLESVTPLWGMKPEEIMEAVIQDYSAMIVAVAAEGLTREWLGRLIDRYCFEELVELNRRHGIHLAGEGGEYETLVLDGPLFKKRIKVGGFQTVWDGLRGHLTDVKAFLS